jgi:hypothetical protein
VKTSVPHHIHLHKEIIEYMKEHIMKYLEVHVDGMLFSLLLQTQER